MSDSTLDPDNIPVGTDRTLGRGHGTRALGPSDNSDSGSDVAGDPDLALDSDTDAEGTGERGAVGLESVEAGSDIGFDHVEAVPLADAEFRDAIPADDDGGAPEELLGDGQQGEQEDLPAEQRVERRDWARTSSPPTSRP
jgi:hypothetical protein